MQGGAPSSHPSLQRRGEDYVGNVMSKLLSMNRNFPLQKNTITNMHSRDIYHSKSAENVFGNLPGLVAGRDDVYTLMLACAACKGSEGRVCNLN